MHKLVIWSKNGIDVTGNESRYQLIESGHKRILKIKNSELDDQGRWRSRSGDKEVFIELHVNAINPIVLAPVKTKWVCVGSSLSLDAELAPSGNCQNFEIEKNNR